MNLLPANPHGNGLLYAGFNQDHGCFACGMENGFRVYNADPLKEKEKQGKMLNYYTMLVLCWKLNLLVVFFFFLMIWDDLKKKTVIEIEFSTEVKAVKLRRDRIVVVLDSMIKVFTFTHNPHQLHVFETCYNPKVFKLFTYCAIVMPFGGAFLFITWLLKCINTWHRKAFFMYSCYVTDSMSIRGIYFCKEPGTLIRIFDTSSGHLIQELRRGSQAANIYCINFNQDASLICVSSDHGTVHIFAAEDPKRNKQSSLASASFLPKYFSSKWSFSKFQVPSGSPCISTAEGTAQHLWNSWTFNMFGFVSAICADGSYYKFLFNQKGECSRDVYAQFLEMTDDKL
ncbi:WIPI3 protein, partial [Columbina picui]|nr:WIPI3 protein [Columbina picui]